jgi:hypothetical protein
MRHAPWLFALAVATVAHADGDRTLYLAVHGSIDGDAVGASIAKELGVDVELAEGTCELPCLDIAIDGKSYATVVFAPRSGSPRQRRVKLGADTRQWRLVITLLAGNVVRDEAQDVLAGLPPRALPAAPATAAPADVPPAPPAPPAPPDPGDAPVSVTVNVNTGGGPAADELPAEASIAAAAAPGAVPVLPTASELDADLTREHRFFQLGFVPAVSTDLTHIGTVRHFLSVNLLVGVSGGSSGLAVSGIADVQRGLTAGFQVAGVAAIAPRVAGTQVAGVAAVAGELDGVQIAGTAAVADRVDGFQAAGVAAVSRSSADTQVGGIAAVAFGRAGTQVAGVATSASGNAGMQLAGVATSARGDAGFQAAGVAAVAGKNANVQISGVASVAHDTANIQISSVVNVARRVRGLQLSTINVADEVDGVQIGIINVGSADGFSLGLINIVPGGRYDLETAVDTDKVGTLLFRHGGLNWHNVYGVAGHSVDDNDPRFGNVKLSGNHDLWMYGFGFGPSIRFGDTVIDLEAMGWQVNHGPSHETDISVLAQARLSVAHHWGPFAVVVGGILNTYITNDQASPLILEHSSNGSQMDKGVTATTWPSAFVGVRI